LPDQVTNRQFLEQFTGGNQEKQQKYIKMFLENAPKLLDNIDRAMAAKDYGTVKITAHSLKTPVILHGRERRCQQHFFDRAVSRESAHMRPLRH